MQAQSVSHVIRKYLEVWPIYENEVFCTEFQM